MIKRFLVAVAAVALTATLAFAAPVKAKVASIEGKKVQVELVGACVGCPASTVTLKAGIERILKDRVEGVTEVEARRAMQLAAAKLPIKTKFAMRFAEEKAS